MNINFTQLVDLAQKGFKVIASLQDAGEDIAPAVTALKNIFTKKKEDITQADIDDTHMVLLDQLNKFNIELED